VSTTFKENKVPVTATKAEYGEVFLKFVSTFINIFYKTAEGLNRNLIFMNPQSSVVVYPHNVSYRAHWKELRVFL
jgi:hypothetical protein